VDELSIRHAAWIARCLGRGGLAPVGADDVVELASELGEERYPAGTTLFRIGEAPARVHIVRSGAVELSRDLRGRRVVLQILRPGDVLGDVPLFVRMTEPYDAIALEDSLVLSVDSLTLYHLLEQRPRLAWRWLQSVCTRMADAQARMVELLAGGLEAQVASVLVHQAENGVVRHSQAVLAELIGGQRSSVNRVLKHLETQRLLRLRYGHVEILNERGLAAAAGLVAPPDTARNPTGAWRRPPVSRP
jgi:CRP-like cAMP-binding protein